MRILGLVLVTSLAVGYLAHTPTRATECDATAVGTAPRAMTDLPIYWGGTLAPVVVEAELQPAGPTRVVARPAAAVGARSGALN
jgi:hypothetical protein